MKAALLIEDRDIGYLFLDAANAPADATPVEFTLAPGVVFSDIESEEQTVWMQDRKGTAIRVVPREGVDFASLDYETECPIPSCIVCLTASDYEAALAQ